LSGGKNQSVVALSCGIILPAAFLFSSVAALPHVFLFTLFGLLLSLLVKKPLHYSDRSLIYSFVAALVLAVLFDMVFPMKQDRFFVMAKLFMANISVPAILYLAVFATFYQSNQYTLGFTSSLSVIALMLCANYQLSGSNEQDLPLIATLLDHFKLFYVSVVLLDTAMILAALNVARKSLHHKSSLKFDWRKKLVYAAAVIITGLSAYVFFTLTETFKNEILKAEAFFRRMRMRDLLSSTTPSGAFFGKEVDLRASANADRTKNRDMVMLRVSGDTPPGYLRGRTYQYYRDARWTESTDPPVQMHYRLNVEGLAVNAFFKNDFPGAAGKTFDIFPTSACVADFLFLPGNTIRIDTVADRIGFTRNGFFKPKTWEPDGGYTVMVERIDQMAAYSSPAAAEVVNNHKYIQTPSKLNGTLDLVLDGIFGVELSTSRRDGRDIRKEQLKPDTNTAKPKSHPSATGTDRAVIEKVKSYFLNNFEYTLAPKIPKDDDTDPVEFFLTKTKRGHCELFATGTALLLRRRGIPTRYVTGLVCFERHPSQNYFVSRLGNAHAWVEAFLRDEGKWVLVDSTPPSADEFHTSFGYFDAWSDRFKQLWRRTFAGIRRGYVARSILMLLTSLFGFFTDLFWDPVRGPVVVVVLWLWLFWKRSKNRKSKRAGLPHETAELSALFARIMKKLQKSLGEPKSPHESPEEWAARIAERNPPEISDEISALIRIYNKARFSDGTPSKDDTAELREIAAECQKSLEMSASTIEN